MIDGKLGTGGFSTVFLVHNTNTEEQYAMKAVNMAADPELMPQLLFEAEVLKSLAGSEYIINLYNSQVNGKELLMILEVGSEAFIDFLCSYQQVRTEMEHSFLRKYFKQMVKAVRFIHNKNIVHCDIKADNYVLVSQSHLKLVDFGCAVKLGKNDSGIFRKRRLGTKHYMSPEYMRDNYASKSLDVWSLGCILYDMVHEQTPYESEEIIRDAVMKRNPDLKHVSGHSDLLALFKSMFEPTSEKRINCHDILHHAYIRKKHDDPASILIPRKAKSQTRFSPVKKS